MWLPHTFPPGKTYQKIYRVKINIDTINWEKIFDRSADNK